MKNLIFFIALLWTVNAKAQSDPALRDSLERRVQLDQQAAKMPPKGIDFDSPKWQQYKDSIFLTNYKWAKDVMAKQGFPGFDRVGKEGSKHFWLMVQHCDKWPDFQQQVLSDMEKEVKNNNANSQDFAYLTDRVKLNTGGKQIYGTQVGYDTDSCKAFSRNLTDPDQVNGRRKSMGLGQLEVYLNQMSELHFEMNKESYEKKGIHKAKLYIVPKD